MRDPLTEAELQKLPEGWYVEQGKLTTRKELATFPDAIAFVQRVAEVAEELDHHPDIDIRWRTVTLAVCTHDRGNAITGTDVRLAERVNQV